MAEQRAEKAVVEAAKALRAVEDLKVEVYQEVARMEQNIDKATADLQALLKTTRAGDDIDAAVDNFLERVEVVRARPPLL